MLFSSSSHSFHEALPYFFYYVASWCHFIILERMDNRIITLFNSGPSGLLIIGHDVCNKHCATKNNGPTLIRDHWHDGIIASACQNVYILPHQRKTAVTPQLSPNGAGVGSDSRESSHSGFGRLLSSSQKCFSRGLHYCYFYTPQMVFFVHCKRGPYCLCQNRFQVDVLIDYMKQLVTEQF